MPDTKVTVGALAGAVVSIIVWVVGLTTSVEVPAEAAAALVTVVSFALAYLVPSGVVEEGT